MLRWTLIAIGAAGVCLAAAGPARAAFPGADGRIAFSQGGSGPSRVATMKPDGSGVRYLHTGNDPTWSANGKRIAFVSGTGDQGEIYTMRADGSKARRLTFTPKANDSSPGFSRGTRIVFGSVEWPISRDSYYRVISMRSDGSDRMVLAWHGVQPEWAPNGKHIVYGGGGIRIMRPDGSHKQRVYSSSQFATGFPHYEANGSIIFARCRVTPEGGCGPTQWMRMNAFGGDLQRLPVAGLFDVQPAPEGDCYVGWGWRPFGDGDEAQNIRTAGLGCPVAGWLTSYRLPEAAAQPSWQPLS